MNLLFIDLCRLAEINPVSLREHWPEPGMYLKPDGIYVHGLEHWDAIAHDEDLTDMIAPHPTGRFHEPALPFPCDAEEAIAFFERCDVEYHFQYRMEGGGIGNRLREHLDKHKSTQATGSAPSAADDASTVPGSKQPTTSVGKIAVEVAWRIEQTTGRRADAGTVMGELQRMANKGDRPDVLIEPGIKCVWWLTSKNAKKDYTLDACGKTLKSWNAGRE